jgi:Na+/H+ antiporter NhaC
MDSSSWYWPVAVLEAVVLVWMALTGIGNPVIDGFLSGMATMMAVYGLYTRFLWPVINRRLYHDG